MTHIVTFQSKHDRHIAKQEAYRATLTGRNLMEYDWVVRGARELDEQARQRRTRVNAACDVLAIKKGI